MSISTLATTPVSKSATATACAKINLTLDVLGRRDDGFHALRSVVLGVDLADTLVARTGVSDEVALSCSDASLSTDDNLIILALDALARHTGRRLPLAVTLQKRIPVAAGLGGGSSDAAAVLRLANMLGDYQLSDRELAEIGSSVGSDVPLFFALPCALIQGRGEIVEPVDCGWRGWMLLVFVGEFVSTREVFANWRKSDTAAMPSLGDLVLGEGGVINAASAEELAALTYNHLERAVFRVAPRVEAVRSALEEKGLGPLRVSGAGSTLFRPFDTKEEAAAAVENLNELGLDITSAVVSAPVEQALAITTKED